MSMWTAIALICVASIVGGAYRHRQKYAGSEETNKRLEAMDQRIEMLEGDLRKRVEILDAITDRAPELPELDPTAMADLKTLGQIVEHMGSVVGVEAAAPAQEPAPATVAVQAPAAPSLNLNSLLLEVVAEKTGYPSDMLTMEMELETDLGVDSIKRA